MTQTKLEKTNETHNPATGKGYTDNPIEKENLDDRTEWGTERRPILTTLPREKTSPTIPSEGETLPIVMREDKAMPSAPSGRKARTTKIGRKLK